MSDVYFTPFVRSYWRAQLTNRSLRIVISTITVTSEYAALVLRHIGRRMHGGLESTSSWLAEFRSSSADLRQASLTTLYCWLHCSTVAGGFACSRASPTRRHYDKQASSHTVSRICRRRMRHSICARSLTLTNRTSHQVSHNCRFALSMLRHRLPHARLLQFGCIVERQSKSCEACVL